ncbi:MAG: amidohydrolase family protein [Clostridia bacterium]|nr:amidohydrolase family protein [Clostridia bacterium]
MEKIFDAHVHYSFGLPIEEMVRIFRKEFEDLNTEKMVFVSVPTHAQDYQITFDSAHNVKGLFLKKAFSPNAYAYAALEHPDYEISDAERSALYLKQAQEYYAAGYDGMKMLEGQPDIRRALKIALDSPVYDAYYSFLEEKGIPVTMHIANPESFWEEAYDDTFASKEQITKEMFGIMQKHPKLKLTLAHFGFMSYDIQQAEAFMQYENTVFDLTPGGEQLIEMRKSWPQWQAFFEKYQNRIIYGTDQYAFPDDDETTWKISYHRRPDFVQRFLETDDEFVYAAKTDTTVKGVKLDKRILNRIYRENLIALLGEPRKIDEEYLKRKAEELLKNLPENETFPEKDDGYKIVPSEREKRLKKYQENMRYIIKYLND